MVTNELLKKQPIGTRLMNDTCPGFKKGADGAWYPIKKWRPYPMDAETSTNSHSQISTTTKWKNIKEETWIRNWIHISEMRFSVS